MDFKKRKEKNEGEDDAWKDKEVTWTWNERVESARINKELAKTWMVWEVQYKKDIVEEVEEEGAEG